MCAPRDRSLVGKLITRYVSVKYFAAIEQYKPMFMMLGDLHLAEIASIMQPRRASREVGGSAQRNDRQRKNRASAPQSALQFAPNRPRSPGRQRTSSSSGGLGLPLRHSTPRDGDAADRSSARLTQHIARRASGSMPPPSRMNMGRRGERRPMFTSPSEPRCYIGIFRSSNTNV